MHAFVGRKAGLTAALGLLILLIALFLSPIVAYHFLGDDAWNSYSGAYLAYNHISAWSLVQTNLDYWITHDGRFFPVNTILFTLLWAYPEKPPVIHAIQIAAIALNVLTLYFALRGLGLGRSTSLLACSFFPMLLQIRTFHDPIIGFSLQMPVTMELFLLSVVVLSNAIHRKSVALALLSALLWILASFTYEIALPLGVILVTMTLHNGLSRAALRESLRTLIPIVGSGTLTVIALAILRHGHAAAVASSPYAINLAFRPYIIAALQQAVAGLPLSYFFFDPRSQYHGQQLWVGWSTQTAAILILGFLVPAIAAYAITSTAAASRHAVLRALVFGGALWLFPTLTIAASPKWQSGGLDFGLGYLPVYFEYFGIATLGAIILTKLTERIAPPYAVVISSAIAVVLASGVQTTFRANLIALNSFSGVWTAGRYGLEDSLHNGLLKNVRGGSTLLVDNSFVSIPDSAGVWSSKYLIYQFSGKMVSVRKQDELSGSQTFCRGPFVRDVCRAQSDLYTLDIHYQNSQQSVATLAHITSMHRLKSGAVIPYTESAMVVVRGAGNASLPSLAGREIHVLKSASGLRSFVVAAHALPLPSSEILDPEIPITPVFDAGFYDEENNPTGTWRWMKSAGSIVIDNPSERPLRIRLTARLSIFGNGKAAVRVDYGKIDERIVVSATGVRLDIVDDIPARDRRTIRLSTTARPLPPGIDPRDLRLNVSEYHVTAMADD